VAAQQISGINRVSDFAFGANGTLGECRLVRETIGGQKGTAPEADVPQGGAGDLFVFLGWFRRTKINTNSKLAVDPTDAHGR
jgi:hypothetical protein